MVKNQSFDLYIKKDYDIIFIGGNMKNIPIYIEKQYLGIKCVYKLESITHTDDKSTSTKHGLLIKDELLIKDDFDTLCDLLFVKDEFNILTSRSIGERIYKLVELSKANSMIDFTFLKDEYSTLSKCGFTQFSSLKELTASKLWADFKKFICNKYGVVFKSNRVNGDVVKSVKGLRLKTLV